jgi:hypothetical protein
MKNLELWEKDMVNDHLQIRDYVGNLNGKSLIQLFKEISEADHLSSEEVSIALGMNFKEDILYDAIEKIDDDDDYIDDEVIY